MTSTNSLNWKKIDFIETGENYSICMQYPYEVRNDITGHMLKADRVNGYLRMSLFINGKKVRIMHHRLVWISHYGVYDEDKFVIDHINHIRDDNRIENLRLVTPSHNMINRITANGIEFDYKNELEDVIIVNEEFGVYYSKYHDKFYRKVVNEFRELHECKQPRCNGTYIRIQTDHVRFFFSTTNFREQLRVK